MRSIFSALMVFMSISVMAQPSFQKELQTRLILAEDGDTIELDAGIFFMDGTLSLEGKNDITIRGKGMDKTILSFKNQLSGAEGLRISNGKGIVLQDFSVEDALGDCIKVMEVEGITFSRVRTAWTGKPSEKNGAYGIYPVLCKNVLIEESVARGASDAGIYVGQSTQIVVRNCRAFENVAGIEIENSSYADVYGNEAYNNTGGILVFDLPDLKVKRGGHCKVYNNVVRENNMRNFAPKGNIVGKVPAGTGILLLAANNVEVYNNQVSNNRTLQAGIVSYYITENPLQDSVYYPYPTGIQIHDNEFDKKKRRATMQGRMGKLYRFKLRFGRNVPDIVFDGILDEKIAKGNNYTASDAICIRNNKGATFAAIDAAHNFKHIIRSTEGFVCQ